MRQIQSVFIVEEDSQGWIINRLMADVAAELSARGIATRVGKAAQYLDEEVIFNSRYMTPFRSDRARVNSLFITHIDDRIKELELRASFKTFNSFVCLSPHDAQFVAALRGEERGVIGIDLPPREQRVQPVRLAYFSARYEDGRKNEQWLLEYFRDKPAADRAAFVFCFLGSGWEPFSAELAALDLNFEIYRYSRDLPGEYDLYKEILRSTDALIYLGFDGGAMSVYDAISAGIRVIAPDASYHRGLGNGVSLFASREQFFAELDSLRAAHAARASGLRARSIEAYTTRLLDHWTQVGNGGDDSRATRAATNPPQAADAQRTLAEFRGHYKRLGLSRVRSALIRWLQLRVLKSRA